MPTYEYKREDGTTFEIRQNINDEPLKTCPDTGQKVKRVISGGGGVLYKGDGWYVTDYKNNGAKKNGTKSENTKADPPAGDTPTDNKSSGKDSD